MTPEQKAEQIVDYLTYDVFLSKKLLVFITSELTEEEINKIWYKLRLNLNALNND